MVLELKEKLAGEEGVDVGFFVESKEQTDPTAPGRHNNGGNGRDFLM